MTNRGALLISGLFLVLHLIGQSEGKIMPQCDAVKLLERAGVSRSMISAWICLMQSESGMNTSLVTGPKIASSYSFGIFQINSRKWCCQGRTGGLCNARCEDFINDNISDDIACALKIQSIDGFKAWDGYMKKCKNPGSLPNISHCKRRRRNFGSTVPSD